MNYVRGVVVLDPHWLCRKFATIFAAKKQWAQNGQNYEYLGHIVCLITRFFSLYNFHQHNIYGDIQSVYHISLDCWLWWQAFLLNFKRRAIFNIENSFPNIEGRENYNCMVDMGNTKTD
jgi:hypothetical protein